MVVSVPFIQNHQDEDMESQTWFDLVGTHVVEWISPVSLGSQILRIGPGLLCLPA
jgi:hypothetical protein